MSLFTKAITIRNFVEGFNLQTLLLIIGVDNRNLESFQAVEVWAACNVSFATAKIKYFGFEREGNVFRDNFSKFL